VLIIISEKAEAEAEVKAEAEAEAEAEVKVKTKGKCSDGSKLLSFYFCLLSYLLLHKPLFLQYI